MRMRELRGKTAVVTGGASGIGRALVERFSGEGMRVVIADVEATALDRTVAELRARGADVSGIVTDVSRFESVQELEQHATETYGPVHLLCNNAGVGAQEDVPLWNLPLSDWRWTFSVNIWGVIHGIKAFVPGMLAHGEEGHVVNTSSGNGGLILLPFTPIYSTSKSAVSTLTEVLHFQLTQMGAKIRASVLYPGPNVVATNIFTASRNRPAEYAREAPQAMPPITLDVLRDMFGGKLEITKPEEVAAYALDGIRRDAFFLLPPNERTDAGVRQRMECILTRQDPRPPSFL
jgi:NAD(P)-dependent dehydrogenase (short-subunit alcohol dehydrogenase family)